jgi:hypothetical protein
VYSLVVRLFTVPYYLVNMGKLLKTFLGSVAIYAAYSAFPQESKALGFLDIPYPSFVLRQECVTSAAALFDDPACIRSGYPPLNDNSPVHWVKSKFVWWEWDPPVNGVTSISFDFFFNPSHFVPVADSAGFLCSFTSSGNCPVESPGVGTQPIGITTTPPITGPAKGTQSIVVGSNSVSVNATFSSPITAASDELFFAMKFEPLFEITDNTRIIYSQELLPNADYYVISYSCTTLDNRNSCGSEDYTASFKVIKTPEPTSILSLLALGTLGAASTLKRKLKPSKSTEKETTKVS